MIGIISKNNDTKTSSTPFLAGIKNMVDEDRGQRAKEILQAQPQLVPALVAIQQRLGIIPAGRSEEAGWGDYKYGQ